MAGPDDAAHDPSSSSVGSQQKETIGTHPEGENPVRDQNPLEGDEESQNTSRRRVLVPNEAEDEVPLEGDGEDSLEPIWEKKAWKPIKFPLPARHLEDNACTKEELKETLKKYVLAFEVDEKPLTVTKEQRNKFSSQQKSDEKNLYEHEKTLLQVLKVIMTVGECAGTYGWEEGLDMLKDARMILLNAYTLSSLKRKDLVAQSIGKTKAVNRPSTLKRSRVLVDPEEEKLVMKKAKLEREVSNFSKSTTSSFRNNNSDSSFRGKGKGSLQSFPKQFTFQQGGKRFKRFQRNFSSSQQQGKISSSPNPQPSGGPLKG